MRFVLPLLFVFSGTLAVMACSSDETPDSGDAGGTIIPTGDGGGGGDDDDDVTSDCTGAAGYDCAKQTAHAKEAQCPKFNEASYKKDCEAVNCGTPLNCEKQQKDLNDCLLKEPVVCEDGNVDPDVPTPCNAANDALFQCLTGS